ncbi:flagellar biosynthesis protein FlhB [bacterium]|nr:flagellar biosynthesis protein FlhB [bacterium]
MFEKDSKTEKPTPKRRSQARQDGNVARSQDLNSAVVLSVGSMMLLWTGGMMFSEMAEVMKGIFRHSATTEITIGIMPEYLAQGIQAIAKIVGPLFIGIMIAGFLVNVGQVGMKVSLKSAKPKFERLNPLSGIKKLFSLRALIELPKSFLKLIVIGGIIYLTIMASVEQIYSLVEIPFENLAGNMGGLLGKVFLMAALSLLIIGILDYAYQKYDFEKSLKMSKEEVKEEAKQSEGDPKVKGKIREIMFKNAFRRMMKAVPEADVVITNPVFLAIALKYDREKNGAPVVLAKGKRKVAERIREIAIEHNIPIVENKPLAWALWKAVEIGEAIPVELYKAVAEVLAYVYRLKNKFFGVA